MKVEFMYKYFMITPVSHLPVANEEGRMEGLLAKKKLMMEMADLTSADREYDKIPAEFMDRDLSEDIINYFNKQRLIPVLDLFAEKKEFWDKPRFLAEYTRFSEVKPEVASVVEDASTVEKASSAIQWYMELILQNFPDALFATDLDGNSIFYNEKFAIAVLAKPIFRNSILFAERYLRDMNRDLFASFLKDHDFEDATVIQTYFKNINMILRVITLKNKNKMAGFLYHFIETDYNLMSESGKSFPSVVDAYNAAFPLEKILADVEKSYIINTLQDNASNISHTADKLGIPRTTLQNRLRQLNIKVENNTPVPRKRINKRKRENKSPKVEISVVKKEKNKKSPVGKKNKVKKVETKIKDKGKNKLQPRKGNKSIIMPNQPKKAAKKVKKSK